MPVPENSNFSEQFRPVYFLQLKLNPPFSANHALKYIRRALKLFIRVFNLSFYFSAYSYKPHEYFRQNVSQPSFAKVHIITSRKLVVK